MPHIFAAEKDAVEAWDQGAEVSGGVVWHSYKVTMLG